MEKESKTENQSQPEENLVKKTCRELGITQKELADMMEVSLPTINRWSATNKMPPSTIKTIELIITNISLNKQLEEMRNVFSAINKYSTVKGVAL